MRVVLLLPLLLLVLTTPLTASEPDSSSTVNEAIALVQPSNQCSDHLATLGVTALGSLLGSAWSTAASSLAAMTLQCGWDGAVQETIALSNVLGGCPISGCLACAILRGQAKTCADRRCVPDEVAGLSACLLPFLAQGVGYGGLLLFGPYTITGFPLPFWPLVGLATTYSAMGVGAVVAGRFGLEEWRSNPCST